MARSMRCWCSRTRVTAATIAACSTRLRTVPAASKASPSSTSTPIRRLAELDMFLNLQCEHDQLELFVPWIERLPIKVLIDHCGRPTPDAGLDQPGFAALLRIAKTQRGNVKLLVYSKLARVHYPF